MAPIVTATLCSSSMTSRLPFAMFGRAPDGQRNAESGPTPRSTAQFDRSPVRLDDALRDPQAQPRALLVLGRKEGLEDVWQVLLRDAVARVPNLDVDRVGHQELGVGAVREP